MIRVRWMAVWLGLAFFLLLARLFEMQLYHGKIYRQRADHNHIRQIAVQPPRGLIYDRNLCVLAENKPRYAWFLVPFEYEAHPRDAERVEALTGLSSEAIQKKINRSGSPFRPIRLAANVSFSNISEYEESRSDYPGVFYQMEPVRAYPGEAKLSHVLGYLGEISRKEMAQNSKFLAGEVVGKSGVEKTYNDLLWGKRGYQYREVDVRGQEVGDFSGKKDVDPVPGLNLMLALDVDLQRQAEKWMQNHRGSIVAMDPANGDVLVYVSTPDYALGQLTDNPAAIWPLLIADARSPLLNRGIQAQLPPGSVYKPVTALAGLRHEVIQADEKRFCPGFYRIGRRLFRCWEHAGHGQVDLGQAIAGSCNVYFYQVGMDLGLEHWQEEGRRWGMGVRTGIDLPDEQDGLLPSKIYMDKKFGKGQWSSAIQANLAVGQGDLLVTPMQMAVMISAVAMGGKKVQPRVVRAVENRKTGLWERKTPVFQTVKCSQDHIAAVVQGMKQAVTGPGGTAGASRAAGVSVYGKTGTAQNPHGAPHAWYIGFASWHQLPRLAVVVLIENGGSGGVAAAPIAGKLIRAAKERGFNADVN